MKNAALITGGARRLGRDIALKLADSGYFIFLHYQKSIKEAKAVLKTIKLAYK